MRATVAEFKTDPGKYLKLSLEDDIYITENGNIIAQLTNPNKDRVAIVKSLIGCISTDKTFEELREERLSQI